MTIWAVGCVVPAPLQAEQGGPASAPRIISGDISNQPTPLFGSFTQSKLDVFSLGFKATDPDPNAKLVGRLYLRDGDKYDQFEGQEAAGQPLNPISGDATIHSVEFNAFTYCAAAPAFGKAFLIYAFVSDQPFLPPPAQPTDLPPNQFTNGLWDFKTWVLTCQE